jgi:hypothetical protein
VPFDRQAPFFKTGQSLLSKGSLIVELDFGGMLLSLRKRRVHWIILDEQHRYSTQKWKTEKRNWFSNSISTHAVPPCICIFGKKLHRLRTLLLQLVEEEQTTNSFWGAFILVK